MHKFNILQFDVMPAEELYNKHHDDEQDLLMDAMYMTEHLSDLDESIMEDLDYQFDEYS